MELQQQTFMERFGRSLVPKKYRPDLRKYMATAGYYSNPYSLFSYLFFSSIIVLLFCFIYFDIYGLLVQESFGLLVASIFLFWAAGIIVLTGFFMGGVYFTLNMAIYKRTKIIDDNLSDYLVLVSTNLKGGLSFEKALWGSIKPEFGILSEEMSLVSKEVMTGTDLNEALMQFAQKYESPSLIRTINIIVGELDAGGKIAKVLDNIIDNLRKTKIIKDEMSANTLMFTIFIGAIVLVISPLLFALAFNLLNILVGVSSMLGNVGDAGAAAGFGGLSFDEISVDPDDFRTFSILALIIISAFSSMIISIIQKGDIKGGIKYLPFFAITSAILYLFFLNFLDGFFNFL